MPGHGVFQTPRRFSLEQQDRLAASDIELAPEQCLFDFPDGEP